MSKLNLKSLLQKKWKSKIKLILTGIFILTLITLSIAIVKIAPSIQEMRICPLPKGEDFLFGNLYYRSALEEFKEASQIIENASTLHWNPSIELKPIGVKEGHFQIGGSFCSIKIFAHDKTKGETQRLTLDNIDNYLESINSKDEAQKLSFLLDFISKGQTGKIISSNEEVKEIKTCSSSEINSDSITCYLPNINVKQPGVAEEYEDYFIVCRFEEDCESSIPRIIYQFSYKIFRDGRIERSKWEKVTNFVYHCIY